MFSERERDAPLLPLARCLQSNDLIEMTEKRSTRKLPAWMNPQGSSSSNLSSYFNFQGTISYCQTVDDMKIACEGLLSQAEKVSELILGLDAEWPVSQYNQPGKIALIQVCADEHTCYLFHISRMRILPDIFQNLIKHPHIRIVGSCVQNDIWKLGRDFDFPVAKLIQSGHVINLGDLANEVFQCKTNWSLARLASYVMSVSIDKSTPVRKSRWDMELSSEQRLYAATDAYVSLAIYKKLKAKQT